MLEKFRRGIGCSVVNKEFIKDMGFQQHFKEETAGTVLSNLITSESKPIPL